VISSAPIRELASFLLPEPQTLMQAANLKYRDFLTVALILESRDVFPDNWIYIHDPRVKVGRIQNYRSWSPEMVPDQALSCLGLEYFCFENDAMWSAADDELIALASRELELLGLCRSGSVLDGTVVRQEKAYPVYDEGYARRVEEVRTELEQRFPTLHLVGRNGMHRYNNQDHSMLTAMLTVRNIVAGRRICDVWSVNEDAAYHESGSTVEAGVASGQRAVPRRLAGQRVRES
jgi:protoporphyrinogen oxidase